MISFWGRLRANAISFLDSFYSSVPRRRSLVHCGVKRKDDIRFKKILLVDDIPQYVENSLCVIMNYYTCGEVTISMAYNYTAALEIFRREQNDLVILDLDLQDGRGDGSSLAKKFIRIRPDVVILANSKIKKYNNILMKNGAVCALEKKKELLLSWLMRNEPLA
jgi:CheY-like chemotaxis protein